MVLEDHDWVFTTKRLVGAVGVEGAEDAAAAGPVGFNLLRLPLPQL